MNSKLYLNSNFVCCFRNRVEEERKQETKPTHSNPTQLEAQLPLSACSAQQAPLRAFPFPRPVPSARMRHGPLLRSAAPRAVRRSVPDRSRLTAPTPPAGAVLQHACACVPLTRSRSAPSHSGPPHTLLAQTRRPRVAPSPHRSQHCSPAPRSTGCDSALRTRPVLPLRSRSPPAQLASAHPPRAAARPVQPARSAQPANKTTAAPRSARVVAPTRRSHLPVLTRVARAPLCPCQPGPAGQSHPLPPDLC